MLFQVWIVYIMNDLSSYQDESTSIYHVARKIIPEKPAEVHGEFP